MPATTSNDVHDAAPALDQEFAEAARAAHGLLNRLANYERALDQLKGLDEDVQTLRAAVGNLHEPSTELEDAMREAAGGYRAVAEVAPDAKVALQALAVAITKAQTDTVGIVNTAGNDLKQVVAAAAKQAQADLAKCVKESSEAAAGTVGEAAEQAADSFKDKTDESAEAMGDAMSAVRDALTTLKVLIQQEAIQGALRLNQALDETTRSVREETVTTLGGPAAQLREAAASLQAQAHAATNEIRNESDKAIKKLQAQAQHSVEEVHHEMARMQRQTVVPEIEHLQKQLYRVGAGLAFLTLLSLIASCSV